MPRLTAKRPKPRGSDDALVVALEEIRGHDPNSLKPLVHKGDVLRGSDPA